MFNVIHRISKNFIDPLVIYRESEWLLEFEIVLLSRVVVLFTGYYWHDLWLDGV
jgi:hypothetical protein